MKMPTGYTMEINEGKKFTRNDFIMRCARAFGALVEMRDLPMDAPIPEFQPSTYAIENLERATKELKRIELLTNDKARAELEAEHQKELLSRKIAFNKNIELLEKYTKLIAEIETWNPPTHEHVELKSFCIKQLNDSIEWDCRTALDPFAAPEKPSLEMWIGKKMDFYNREIEYYEKDHRESVKRANGRNEWVKKYRLH